MCLYLDYSASTPIDQRVLDHMNIVYIDYFGNPDSRTHEHGISAQRIVTESRNKVANLLGVEKNEIVFTSGATESNNLAILGLYEYGIQSKKNHIITTSIEHKAVLEPVKRMKELGFDVDIVFPDNSGRVSADEIIKKVNSNTLLVSVMHANNETGVIQPVMEIGKYLNNTGTLFHVDAAQSCGKLVKEIQNLEYDLMSITSHKMYGPQGVGALILRIKNGKKPPVAPIMFGGGQEGGVRPGTLPTALISGMGAACEIAIKEFEKNMEHYQKNKLNIISSFREAGVDFVINGSMECCLSNVINLSFIGIDSEALMIAAKQYCSISNGSACTSKNYEASHVLKAMGLPDSRIESAIRLSWGADEIKEESVKKLINVIKNIIN